MLGDLLGNEFWIRLWFPAISRVDDDSNNFNKNEYKIKTSNYKTNLE